MGDAELYAHLSHHLAKCTVNGEVLGPRGNDPQDRRGKDRQKAAAGELRRR